MKNKCYVLLAIWLITTNLTQGQISPMSPIESRTVFANYLVQARAGSPKFMYLTAESYSRGHGVSVNYREAYNWFQKAANAGYCQAYYRLGLLHKYGLGTPMDYSKAYQCFQASTTCNDPKGIYSLGYMHYKGLGCQQDYQMAFNLFVKASEMKETDAMYFRGLCYRNGYGTIKDETQARNWLFLALSKGNPQARHELTSQQPENISFNGTLRPLIENAKKRYSKTGSVERFSKEVHDKKITAASLSGSYKGYIFQYDWSGSTIIHAAPLELVLTNENGKLKGNWKELGQEEMVIKANIFSEGINFEESNHRKTDHYNKYPAKFLFKRASLKQRRIGDSLYLYGSIDIDALERKEPEKPTKIFLTRSSTTTSLNTSENKASLITKGDGTPQLFLEVFPNPFFKSVNVKYELKSAGVIQIDVFDNRGAQVYKSPSTYREAGKYNLQINLNVTSGTYLVKIMCGTTTETKKIIKQ